MLRLKRPGKFHIQVCTCVPCCLVGGEELLEQTEKKLSINCPTLVLTGDEDYGNSPEMSIEISKQIKKQVRLDRHNWLNDILENGNWRAMNWRRKTNSPLPAPMTSSRP